MVKNNILLEIEDLFYKVGYPARIHNHGQTDDFKNFASSDFHNQIPVNISSERKKRKLPCPFGIEESQYAEPIGVGYLESSITAWGL